MHIHRLFSQLTSCRPTDLSAADHWTHTCSLLLGWLLLPRCLGKTWFGVLQSEGGSCGLPDLGPLHGRDISRSCQWGLKISANLDGQSERTSLKGKQTVNTDTDTCHSMQPAPINLVILQCTNLPLYKYKLAPAQETPCTSLPLYKYTVLCAMEQG